MQKMVIVIVAVLSWPSLVWSQSANERFVGTWMLERIETQNEAGAWIPAETRFGSHPIGILTYDDSGNMTAQIMRRDRTLLSSRGATEGQAVTGEALARAPAEEKAIAFDGYTAYFGKYSVREAEGVVTHQRMGHLVPNQADLAVERHFEFIKDMLVLTVPGWNRLVWKRVN